ncbi:hypothetical protein V8J88_04515 [Massilia sp. W12]|uniref:IS66 family insertion sequence element accessory protein TnpA n=2 Tax=Massilia sp. W12 TaxID=3126507 RepID=UPI0030D3F121
MDSYQDPKPGKTYISPRLDAFGDSERKVRIATKLIEQPETYAFATIKGELVLRHKEDAKTCIKAKFFEDDRGIFVLNCKRPTAPSPQAHKTRACCAHQTGGASMQSKSPKKSREEWLAHVRAWRMSGQTQSAYCRQHEINLPVLQYWIKRSRSGSESAPLTLVAAQAPTGAISAPISGNLTLECGAQRLHIPLHVPAQWLAALLRELA